MRTAEDFLEDMLLHGRDWVAIMAVAGVVRHGIWKPRVEEILVDRKLIPTSKAERIEIIEARIKAANDAEMILEAERKKNRNFRP